MKKAKRFRDVNFEPSDKILLRQLIDENAGIIENKNVDTETSRKKRNTWREITNLYNDKAITLRDTPQLQALWRGMKRKAKKKAKEESQSTSSNSENKKMMTFMPQGFEEIHINYDCDLGMTEENDCSNSSDKSEEEEYESQELLLHDDDETKKQTSLRCSDLPSSSETVLPQNDFKEHTPSKMDERYQKQLLDFALEKHKLQKRLIEQEHKEKLKSIIMERKERLNILEMEKRHKEEIHSLQMKRLKSSFKF